MCNKHVYSTVTPSSLSLSVGVINKPTTAELCISPVYLSKVADFDPVHLHSAPS